MGGWLDLTQQGLSPVRSNILLAAISHHRVFRLVYGGLQNTTNFTITIWTKAKTKERKIRVKNLY